MGASYIYTPLISSFARSFHAKDKHALLSLLVKAVFAMAGVCVAAGVVLTLLGEWVLVLFFGESITPFTYMLLPAIIMTAITAFLWFFNDILIAAVGEVKTVQTLADHVCKALDIAVFHIIAVAV